jgi:hypothetical protein
MKTLVVGLGNPILGDDEAGWRVAEVEISFRKTGQWERLYGRIPSTIMLGRFARPYLRGNR